MRLQFGPSFANVVRTCRVGVSTATVVNWEKERSQPVAAQFPPVIAFLGYDPTPQPQTLADRLEAKQRRLGTSLAQVAKSPDTSVGTLAA